MLGTQVPEPLLQYQFDDNLLLPATPGVRQLPCAFEEDHADLMIADCGDLLNDLLGNTIVEPALKRPRLAELEVGDSFAPESRLTMLPLPSPTWPEPHHSSDAGLDAAADTFDHLPSLNDALTSSGTSALDSPQSPKDRELFMALPSPPAPLPSTERSSQSDMDSAAPATLAAASSMPSASSMDEESAASRDEGEKTKQPRKTSLPWSTDEDAALRAAVEELGPKKWSAVAQKVGSRSGKQCRLRWCARFPARRGWGKMARCLLRARAALPPRGAPSLHPPMRLPLSEVPLKAKVWRRVTSRKQ